MKRWIIKKPDVEIAKIIEQSSNLNILCSEILVSRGISNIGEASDLLRPCMPENPYIMKDMKEAVEIINDAVDNGKKVCVFGDYDCDGVISTVMLYSYLQYIGIDAFYYIPERDEGYGMNESAIRIIKNKGAEVIITVDNGISAIKEAELISELGMELLITDHHQPGEILPKAKAIVNPHRKDCPSSFKELCGAGVVLKLICAVEGGDYEFVMEQFGDIAAIATIADIVKINRENRYIVQCGLEYLANTERLGLSALMNKCNMTAEKIDSVSVSFNLAPRINAVGRYGSPRAAVSLLMCEDEEEALRLADELDSLNTSRKEAENKIVSEIVEYINKNPETLNKRVLVFSGENWHHGIIGIASIRITEHFGKPCFIITRESNGMSRGSARSFDDFSIFKCLDYCSELLDKFGGHMGAGGFSLKTENIEKFDEMIQKYAFEYHEKMPVYSVVVDKFIRPEEITIENIRSIKMLEPFGEGNDEPLFLINGATVENVIPLSNGLHTKILLNYGGVDLEALIFRVSPEDTGIRNGEKWNFIVTLSINSFRGKNTVSALVKDYRKCGIKQEKYIYSEELYGQYARNELDNVKLLCPKREELTLVYKYLGNVVQTINNLYMNLEPQGIDYCKLRICIDIFKELGLIKFDLFSNKIQRIPVNVKVNLDNSEILRRLNEKS